MNYYLFFWRIEKRRIPIAFYYMAVGHLYLKFNKKIGFYKLLGTGKGETFTPKDADLTTWAALIKTSINPEELKLISNWNRISVARKYFQLTPVASKGSWGKASPFEIVNREKLTGKVAVITRARIKYYLLPKFWRSVPAVVSSLKLSPGIQWAIGIGESPIGLQGTFSVWESSDAVKQFAYSGIAHKEVINRTHELNWYSEELFARFAVIKQVDWEETR